jgi:recombination protein RecT
VQWWDEMARKTVIRRIAKRLPSSADLDQTLELDNETTGFVQAPAAIIEPDAEGVSRVASRLKAKINQAKNEPIEGVAIEVTEEAKETVDG